MTARLHFNLLKGIFLTALFIILMAQTFLVNAQSHRGSQTYKGLVANFGTRSSELSSSLGALNNASLQQAGGSVGLIIGNSIVRSKIGLLGYYSSTGNTAGTTDLYESNVAVNFYPLAWIMKKSTMIAPYLTGGLDYDQFKFFGFYVNREPGQLNYSQADAPYLGKIKQVNATLGAGIEVRLKDEFDFIHLFAEARYGKNLSSKAGEALFADTNITRQTQVRVGISFGAFR